MTRSLEVKPVRVGRYRYSKWRWRIAVRAFDLAGGLAMRLWRAVRPAPRVDDPRRILLVQLDHLGDAVLTSPLITRLRAAYPAAAIDVLASPSNLEVFQADPNVDRVVLAERNWFERRTGRFALWTAVWALGRQLRGGGYDVGIDVRGDILTVCVLALAGVPRRLGWAMGGGGFLLTDVAVWVPGRHEVASRMALIDLLGASAGDPPRVVVHVTDRVRTRVARRLREAWSTRSPRAERTPQRVRPDGSSPEARRPRVGDVRHGPDRPDADWLHAGRFGSESPLLAVHLGAGTAAKRWPPGHWKVLIDRFLAEGWRVIIVGGPDDTDAAVGLSPHHCLRDWTGLLSVPETTALLERADLFIGADSGPSHLAASAGIPSIVLFSGTNRSRQWRPWSRRSLVLRHDVPCRPCHQKVCPLADHPCMSGLSPDRVYRAARRWWARLHREESPHAPI